MSRTAKGSNPNQPYIYGMKNENYVGPQPAAEGMDATVASMAAEDFVSTIPQRPAFANLSSSYDTNPIPDCPLYDENDQEIEEGTDKWWEAADIWMDFESEMTRDEVSHIVSQWSESLPEDTTHICIVGTGKGWTSSTGFNVIDIDEFTEDPVDIISPNTNQLTQEWKTDSYGRLTALQSHHDAMGEHHTFIPMNEEMYDRYEEEYLDYLNQFVGKNWNPTTGEIVDDGLTPAQKDQIDKSFMGSKRMKALVEDKGWTWDRVGQQIRISLDRTMGVDAADVQVPSATFFENVARRHHGDYEKIARDAHAFMRQEPLS